MNIIYKNINDFKKEDLERLFLSVEWASGNYPEKLVVAMKNYGSVFTAWHNDRLIGLISTMDDGVMTAYIHYLLVDPNYQGKGVGKQLVKMTTEHYKNFLRITLVSYNEQLEFYKHCGFIIGEGKTPMSITSLLT